MIIGTTNHPLLLPVAIETTFSEQLGQLKTDPAIIKMLDNQWASPIQSDENTKSQVRNVLRHGGYKPTGRGKPASEYLIKAVDQGRLSSINPAVDILNVVSLHSGFPISVVDAALAPAPLLIDIAGTGTEYVFNASGQTIKLDGLVCLFDKTGPCANGVKDSQRTKTSEATVKTISIIWGAQSLKDQVGQTARWYLELLKEHGAKANEIPVTVS